MFYNKVLIFFDSFNFFVLGINICSRYKYIWYKVIQYYKEYSCDRMDPLQFVGLHNNFLKLLHIHLRIVRLSLLGSRKKLVFPAYLHANSGESAFILYNNIF